MSFIYFLSVEIAIVTFFATLALVASYVKHCGPSIFVACGCDNTNK